MEPSFQTTVSQPGHPAQGFKEEVPSYRTLSVLAVVSLVFGVAAPLSLVASLLLVIPIFGAVVAVIALRRIATSGGLIVGRGAALIGLALCVASVGAVSGRAFMTRQLVFREASDFALQWIALLENGDAQQAFEWTVEGARPSAATSPERKPPLREEKPRPAVEVFQEDPVVRALMGSGPKAAARLDRDVAIEFGSHSRWTVQQLYSVGPADRSQVPIQLRLTLQRWWTPAESSPRWLVVSYKQVDEPTAAVQDG